ncbi:FecCD family ABC transporter permease [Oceanicola sp. S124]|uniref:FecCD family ABC transporter permease n=1 Tax=Oceanicola sp. S124 TaxID=1042378 RepID=UPI0002557A43|nr:iron ABC transporter permease [Oceanicola sp. S124]
MTRAFPLLLLLLLLACIASLHLGLRFYSPGQVWAALQGGTGTEDIIIRTLRLPRTLIGAACGGALGLSGLLMQAVTRNPLAEPGLLGVNAGAAFAVTLGLTVFAVTAPLPMALLAVAGALLTTALVFGIGLALGPAGGDGTTLLIGVTIAAMLGALTQVMLLLDETAMETLLFWLSGGFADRPTALLSVALPLLLLALASCALLSGGIDALRLDDQSAQGIGVGVTRLRLSALALAALLAAISVSLAGPVVFLGLVAPHIARRLSTRRLPFFTLALATLLTGAIIAVMADILARVIVAPGEAPIGAVLAMVGVPFLIHLLRRTRGGPA